MTRRHNHANFLFFLFLVLVHHAPLVCGRRALGPVHGRSGPGGQAPCGRAGHGRHAHDLIQAQQYGKHCDFTGGGQECRDGCWCPFVDIGRPQVEGCQRQLKGETDQHHAEHGEKADGQRVVTVFSTGIDLDVIPFAVDARLYHADPETELVVVVPKRDVSPVTTRLVEMMKHPARVVGV